MEWHRKTLGKAAPQKRTIGYWVGAKKLLRDVPWKLANRLRGTERNTRSRDGGSSCLLCAVQAARFPKAADRCGSSPVPIQGSSSPRVKPVSWPVKAYSAAVNWPNLSQFYVSAGCVPQNLSCSWGLNRSCRLVAAWSITASTRNCYTWAVEECTLCPVTRFVGLVVADLSQQAGRLTLAEFIDKLLEFILSHKHTSRAD